jgi:hypothetical protein
MQARFDISRGFGVEIETARTREHSPTTIASALINAGIPTVAPGYTHRTMETWKVVPDATCGSEIVSPILYGQDGLDQIKAVCEVLRNIGLRVDSNTGLHVHHDARDLTARQFASAMYLYAKAEPFLAALLPTRTNSPWCRVVGLEELAHNYRRYVRGSDWRKNLMTNGRYYATNPTNANTTGTLEFRQHSGSLNGTKIASWVVFTQGFINAGIARNISAVARPLSYSMAEALMHYLGSDTNCETTKAARRNIVQRVFVNNPWFYLGSAARYLTTAQRRQVRTRFYPGTLQQHRADVWSPAAVADRAIL